MNIVSDARYMYMAVDEAIKGVVEDIAYGGQVGAVLVDSVGDIISKSCNKIVDGVRRHAEEIVVSCVDLCDFKKSTLYVTVEPCNGNPYHVRGHCCEQIVDAGIGRVVVGARKQKFEGGIEYMLNNGVEVDVLENERLFHLCNLLKSSNKESSFSNKVLSNMSFLRNSIGCELS